MIHLRIPSFVHIGCFIILVPISNFVVGQDTARTYTFKEVGMTLTLPPAFKTMDSAKNASLNQSGLKLMEESNNITADISSTKTLIAATKSPFNYFNSTITPYDPKKDGSYTKSNQVVKGALYKTFLDKIPSAKIDSSTTNTTIDGLQFDKFQVAVTLNGKSLFHLFLLSRYYKGYDLGISYLYLDEAAKDQIEAILKSCKFQ